MTAVRDVDQLGRGELAVLARELLLAGQLIDRSGMPHLISSYGREVMGEIAIDEWMGASPIYTRRTQQLLGFGDADAQVGTAPFHRAAHQRGIRYHDHPGVPAVPQGGDAPPAQRLGRHGKRQHRPAQPADERAVQQPHLEHTAQQQCGVDDHHHRVVTQAEFSSTLRKCPPGVAF